MPVNQLINKINNIVSHSSYPYLFVAVIAHKLHFGHTKKKSNRITRELQSELDYSQIITFIVKTALKSQYYK